MNWSVGVRRSPANCRSSWTRQRRNSHNVVQGWPTRMRLLDAYIGGCRMPSGLLLQAVAVILLVHTRPEGVEAVFVWVPMQPLLAEQPMAASVVWETQLLCALLRAVLLVLPAVAPSQWCHHLAPSHLVVAVATRSPVPQRLGDLAASCPLALVPLELPLHQAGAAARPQHKLALGCQCKIRCGTPGLQKRPETMHRSRIFGKR